jgi:GNAT superfamily N-acetyltransferase
VQKYIRRTAGRQFVAVTCHADLVDWLQPDWVVDMATRSFTRRLLQRRPSIDCVIGRVPRAAWQMFAPYHYLTAHLHPGARCYGLWVKGTLAAFAGVFWIPVSSGKDKGDAIYQVSRLVTLPDWQGLGLAMVLVQVLGAEHKSVGRRFRTYPAHPALVHNFAKSPDWQMLKEPGYKEQRSQSEGGRHLGGRPCAVFQYCGPAAETPTLGLE